MQVSDIREKGQKRNAVGASAAGVKPASSPSKEFRTTVMARSPQKSAKPKLPATASCSIPKAKTESPSKSVGKADTVSQQHTAAASQAPTSASSPSKGRPATPTADCRPSPSISTTRPKMPVSATSRCSAQSEGSSFVAVSPLTTPGNSSVPLSRRRASPPGGDAAAAAVVSDEGTSAGDMYLRTRRPVATTEASGGTPDTVTKTIVSYHHHPPASKAQAGMPLSRGQLPTSAASAASTRQQPLARQMSSKTHTLTTLTATQPAKNADGTARELSSSASGHHKGESAQRPTSRSSTNYYDQLEQMEAVMDYVDSITQALAQRTRSLPPPDTLTSFRGTIFPAACRGSASPAMNRGFGTIAEEETHCSLLSNLHDASSALLSAFSKLEYTKMSQSEPLQELERSTLQSCAKVLAVVEKVDRKFTTHEDADLRIAFKQRRNVVIACQEYVDSLTQTAQQIVLLRKLTAMHDLFRVREVFEELREVMQRRVITAASPLSAKYQEMILAGPFFEWLQQRWLPAMRAWRKIVLEARQTAGKGDVEGALAHSQQELLSVPALQDILRPGETLTELHHKEIELPITELEQTFGRKKSVMDQLEAAIEQPTLAVLGKAIQASQEFSRVKSRTQQLSVEDDERIGRAKQLLCDLQETELVRRAMESALQMAGGSSLTLFQPLQRANELIFRLDLAQSPAQADHVIRASKAVVSKMSSLLPTDEDPLQAFDGVRGFSGGNTVTPQPILAELLPATVSPHDLCIAHVPSKVWTSEASTTYQQLCQRLTEVSVREMVRRDLEKAMAADTTAQMAAPPLTGGGLTNSSLNTTCREEDEELGSNGRHTTLTATSSVTSPRAGSSATAMLSATNELEELQNRLHRAEELGLSGALVEQAKARIAQLNTIRLKVRFDAQTRIIPIADPDNTPFDSVYERLYADCVEQLTLQRPAEDQRLRIRYEDLDGDFISILNDADWQMMLGERAPRGRRAGIKVELYCDFLILPGAPRVSGGGGPAATPIVGPAVNRAVEKEGRALGRAHPAPAGPTTTPTRQGRAGGPGASSRLHPATNNASRLRAASRTRYGSPMLTVENLTRSQSKYTNLSQSGGLANPKKQERATKPRTQQQPPALVQDSTRYEDEHTNPEEHDKVQVPSTKTIAPASLPAAVALNLDACKRWEDDEESRFSVLELQTIASVSTVKPNRLIPPPPCSGEGITTPVRLNNAAVSRVDAQTTEPAYVSRFTATNCSKASPGKSPQKPVQAPLNMPSPMEAKRWDEDENGDSIFDEIHTIYSDDTRVRDSRGLGASTIAAAIPRALDITNSEKENECARAGAPMNTGHTLAGDLPPRPNPYKRTGTPNRPRAPRGCGSRNPSEDEAAAHRDANDLLSEMQRLREQNQQAMRTPTPRRVWH